MKPSVRWAQIAGVGAMRARRGAQASHSRLDHDGSGEIFGEEE